MFVAGGYAAFFDDVALWARNRDAFGGNEPGAGLRSDIFEFAGRGREIVLAARRVRRNAAGCDGNFSGRLDKAVDLPFDPIGAERYRIIVVRSVARDRDVAFENERPVARFVDRGLSFDPDSRLSG